MLYASDIIAFDNFLDLTITFPTPVGPVASYKKRRKPFFNVGKLANREFDHDERCVPTKLLFLQVCKRLAPQTSLLLFHEHQLILIRLILLMHVLRINLPWSLKGDPLQDHDRHTYFV